MLNSMFQFPDHVSSTDPKGPISSNVMDVQAYFDKIKHLHQCQMWPEAEEPLTHLKHLNEVKGLLDSNKRGEWLLWYL